MVRLGESATGKALVAQTRRGRERQWRHRVSRRGGRYSTRFAAQIVAFAGNWDVTPSGSIEPLRADIRLVSATHRDLEKWSSRRYSARICITASAPSPSTCLRGSTSWTSASVSCTASSKPDLCGLTCRAILFPSAGRCCRRWGDWPAQTPVIWHISTSRCGHRLPRTAPGR